MSPVAHRPSLQRAPGASSVARALAALTSAALLASASCHDAGSAPPDAHGAVSGDAGGGGDAGDGCTNGVRDGQETDVDCGGPVCPGCATGRACHTSDDCAGDYCAYGRCGGSPPPISFTVAETRPVGASPAALVLADLDGDKRLDVATADVDGAALTVLLGTGGGHLAAGVDYPAGDPAPRALALGDFDGDHRLDLAVGRTVSGYLAGTVGVVRGRGDGTLLPPSAGAATPYPYAIAAGDVDGDGRLDVVAVRYPGEALSLLRGRGDGTFAPAVAVPIGHDPLSVALADLDGDGHLDAVVGLGKGLAVARGRGDGTFAAPTVTGTTLSGATIVADFNGDGRPDVACTAGVLLGQGGGVLGPPIVFAGSPFFSLAAADFDHDGRLDLAGAGGVTGKVTVWLGRGDGTFQTPLELPPAPMRALAVGDVDGDGRPDLVAASYEASTVTVLLNATK